MKSRITFRRSFLVPADAPILPSGPRLDSHATFIEILG
jgi:hypothetical protein